MVKTILVARFNRESDNVDFRQSAKQAGYTARANVRQSEISTIESGKLAHMRQLAEKFNGRVDCCLEQNGNRFKVIG